MSDFNFITNRVATGARLTTDTDVQELLATGVNYIIDCSMNADVSMIAGNPNVHYLFNGTEDDGQPKPTSWFAPAIDFALEALARPHNKVY